MLALMEHGGSCGHGILVVTLLSVREYKYGGGFDAGDCDGDDGGCNNGFDGDGTINCCAGGEGIILLGWRLL